MHDSAVWPMIDEFGIDISPSTSTLAPITEVISINYCLLTVTANFIFQSIYDSMYLVISSCISQVRISRQTDPYVSNCTTTWRSTNYTALVRDPNGTYTSSRREMNYNDTTYTETNYNLAVI